MIQVLDNVLSEPWEYRTDALLRKYGTFEGFQGIAPTNKIPPITLPEGLQITLTFFRKSPFGQVEPNFIHHDRGMGEWTGILYLNPEPPVGDGTDFWQHRETGRSEDNPEVNWSIDGKDPSKWERVQHVRSVFNRLLLFSAPLFHSRAIHDNYGDGDSARLIHVMFGVGKLA